MSVVFEITRTSQWDEDQKPCSEAYEGTIDVWDVRTCKSPEEFDTTVGKRYGERWFDKGTDHQIVRGPRGGAQGIKRRMPDRKAWFVRLDSLNDLMAFYERHGDLVICESWSHSTTLRLEIYDGYRE